MDIDAIGEEEEVIPEPVAQLESTPTTSLKRSGDELEGGEAKRVKEDAAVPFADGTPVLPPAFASTPAVQAPVVVPDTTSVAAPSNLPAPAPASVDAAPVAPVATVPINYVPPPPRPGGPTTPLTITQHKHILGAVRSLKKAKEAVPFLAPVDPVLFNIPHYPTIVTKPMDLGTVEKKLVVSDPRGPPKDKSKMKNWDLTVGTYGSVSDVTADVRQIWENTRMFNGPDHLVSLGANKLEQIYESALTKIPAEVSSFSA
jgi:bromodomain-containing factor 1